MRCAILVHRLIHSTFALSITVVLRPHIQQHCRDRRLQTQRRLRDQQEESHRVQGLSAAQVPAGGHVQEWITLWPPFQLVQDTLSAAGAAGRQRTCCWGRGCGWWHWRCEQRKSRSIGTSAAGKPPGASNVSGQNQSLHQIGHGRLIALQSGAGYADGNGGSNGNSGSSGVGFTWPAWLSASSQIPERTATTET